MFNLEFYKCGRISKQSAKTLKDAGLKWCTGCKQPVNMTEFYYPQKSSLCHKCDCNKSSKYFKGIGKDKHRQNTKLYKKLHPEAIKKSALKTVTGNGRYSYNKAMAKHVGRTWTLTKTEYNNLIKNPCTYCTLPIGNRGYGLDRIDNSKGYEINNVLPCCKDCNVARNDNFSSEEMKLFIGPAIRQTKLARNV